ncbi:MAG: hypothetical protein AAFW00_16320 [Bacteroidota bacterium]
MKVLIVTICLLFLTQLESFAQTEFTLDPSQSMLMTGKGLGQDATINPYEGEDCYAVVQNIGKRAFSIRIQKKGTIIRMADVLVGETKKIILLKGQELYLDPNEKGRTKAVVDYAKMETK